jgi:hypothetical protein
MNYFVAIVKPVYLCESPCPSIHDLINNSCPFQIMTATEQEGNAS